MVFGGLLFVEVLRYFYYGWIETHYIAPAFHFTYPFLDFVRPWPGAGMYIHFAILGGLALLVAAGLFYRLAAVLLCLAFTYVFLLDKALYLNHFYLITLLSFLLCLLPAHAAASLDRQLFLRHQAPVVPRWAVWVLRAQLFIVYFYAGLAKLSPDWLQGEPMRLWLAERTHFPIVGQFFTLEWVVYGFAYGGLLFDLSIGFFLLLPQTRLWALGAAGLFHFLNLQLFNIGIFPALAFGATLIFFEPTWPVQLVARVQRQLPWSPGNTPAPPTAVAHPLFSSLPLLVLLHVYLLFQLLFPLRHWLYPGDVNWTEEGHRFAWHMKLRAKEGRLDFYLTNPKTGETVKIYPAWHLSANQMEEMSTHPDMIAQYARYVADRFERSGWPRPMVRVDSQVALNGRPYQPFIDPNVNLAEVPLFSWQAAPWILPQRLPLHSQR